MLHSTPRTTALAFLTVVVLHGVETTARDFDVHAWGARGDGTTDDTASIQLAIDEAVRAGGGRVVFPRSALPYRVSGTLSVRGSHVELYGPGAILQRMPADRGHETVDLIEVRGTPGEPLEDIVIRGLVLDADYFGEIDSYRPRALRVAHARRVLADRLRIRRVWVGLTFGPGAVECEARDCIVRDWDNDAYSASGDGQTAGCRDIRFVRCLAFDAPDETAGGRPGFRHNAWEIEDGATGVRLVECVVDRCGGNAFAVRSHGTGENTTSDIEFFRCQARRVGGVGWYLRGWSDKVRTRNVRLVDCFSEASGVVFRGVDQVEVRGSRFEDALWIGLDRAASGRVEPAEEARNPLLPARSIQLIDTQTGRLMINARRGVDGGGPYDPSIRLASVVSEEAPRVFGSADRVTRSSSRVAELGPLPARLRWNYHVPPRDASGTEVHQATVPLLSPLILDSGEMVSSSKDWYGLRRPELMRHWQKVLGKLEPSPADRQWFGDITRTRERYRQEREGYTRIEFELPIEKDFLQPHVLLIPRGQGVGPFPAVIAWTSTSPDYRQPEAWWGSWLASRGYVVLCGWSFIRHYRDGRSYATGVNEAVYERFGRWLPMAKMVHDVQREVEYLSKLPVVDSGRIGFIGFSLSAKSALYVGAFAPEVKATVSIDPHIALHGETNYDDPWYLDWRRKFADIDTDDYPAVELRGTVQSLLNPDIARPGFERNHHELLALCAPRAFLLIGCSTDREGGTTHSDNRQSWSYFNRAREVYELLGIPERLEFAAATDGHRATSPRIDAAWKGFFARWLKKDPEERTAETRRAQR